LRRLCSLRDASIVTERVIYREEVVRLLFGVYDISETLKKTYELLAEEGDDGEEGDES
jgi:hypothetical protein